MSDFIKAVHPHTKMPVIRVDDIPEWARDTRDAADLAVSLLGFSPWEVQPRLPGLNRGATRDWWLPPVPQSILVPGQALSPPPTESPCIPLWLPMGDTLAVRLLAGVLSGFDPFFSGLSFHKSKGPNWILEQPYLTQVFFVGSGVWEIPMETCLVRGFGVPDLIQSHQRRADVLAQILFHVWADHPTYRLDGVKTSHG